MNNINNLNLQTLQTEFINNNQICHIKINRPTKLNAMNEQFFQEMQTLFASLETCDDLRCVMLTGNGKGFSAGLDLTSAQQSLFNESDLDGARKALSFMQHLNFIQNSINCVENCRVPVLVGVHGICVGGGIDLITAADIRYCSQDAKFTIKEIDIGLAADLGTLQRFPLKTNNDSLFRELVFTGRFFTAKEALYLGLVSHCLENQDYMIQKMMQDAKGICEKSPVGIWANKHVINHDFKKQVVENIQYMQAINGSMTQTSDIMNAVLATLKKQTPKFPKL